MQPAGTVSDDKGRFRFISLAPAQDYVLTAELSGYAKVEIGPIDLDPGKTTAQNVTLVPASEATETVTIVAKGDVVDVASTKTATVFNSEFIEGLPLMGRRYQDVLTLAPGVTDVDGDGNPNVNGARVTNFQTRVDGVNTTDPLSGTFGQNLNVEAIGEIEVITTGASAEFSQAQGGFANIVTKSGGNHFEGSFKFFYRTDELDGDGANNSDIGNERPTDAEGFRDVRPFLTVGGPIVKDHLWYFAAIQYIDLETPVDTLTDRILRTEEGWNNFGKLTWQPNASHRLSLSYNSDPRDFTGLGLATGVAPESDFEFNRDSYNLTAGWTYNISPSLLLEARVARLDTDTEIVPITEAGPCEFIQVGETLICDPFADDAYTIDIVTGITRGPYFQEASDERTRDTLRMDLSLFVDGFGGTHNLKMGLEYADEDYQQTQRQDRIRILDRVVEPESGGGTMIIIHDDDDDEVVLDVSGLIQIQDSYPNVFGGVGCIPVTSSDVDPLCGQAQQSLSVPPLEAEKENYGFYIQDSFKPIPNLALNLGLRVDREEASSQGWTAFEPEQEARQFLELLSLGNGRSVEEILLDPATGEPRSFGQAYTEQLGNPGIQFDMNGDGRDGGHCTQDFLLDRYDNSLVTGFRVNEDGTYTLVGEPGFDQPDAMADNFFLFIDGGGAGSCSGGPRQDQPCDTSADCPTDPPGPFTFTCLPGPDGVASFDPSLAGMTVTAPGQYGDAARLDQIQFDPAAGFAADNVPVNPNCDRLNEDIVTLFSVFSRHQLDLVQGPVEFPAPIPGLDNDCDSDQVLPGTCRTRESFTITNDNLAPRLSASWDPWRDNRTKIFASWGRYFDKLFLATLVPELGPDPRVTVYAVGLPGEDDDSGGLPDPDADPEPPPVPIPLTVGRFSTTQIDRDLKTPFVDEFTIGFERELAPEWVVGLTYIHRDGRDQLQDIDYNHFAQDANGDGILDDNFGRIGFGFTDVPPLGTDDRLDPSDFFVRAPDDQPDLFGFNPLFNQILRVGNHAISDFDSVQLRLTRRLSRRWQMTSSYVWSEATGFGEAFDQAVGNDPGTVEDEYGFLEFDQTHVVKFSAVALLPGNQSLGTSIQWASGLPYSEIRVRGSGDIFDSFGLRTTFPSGARNDLRNEGRWNIDLAYRKNLSIARTSASLGLEVQDLLNSDDLRIFTVDNTRAVGLDSIRDFGRRWQVSLEIHY
jgi:hypothetical protein